MSNFDLFDALAATAHAMGQTPTPEGLALMAQDLADFCEQDIATALRALRRKNVRFCVAAILDELQSLDGRPSPDRAWAMMPKFEHESAVLTNEMMDAWSVASELYSAGDVVGAQIAFKREYSLVVSRARDTGEPARWFPSLGSDPSLRADAVTEAVSGGRMSFEAAYGLLTTDDGRKRLVDAAVASGVVCDASAAALMRGCGSSSAGAKKIIDDVRYVLRSSRAIAIRA